MLVSNTITIKTLRTTIASLMSRSQVTVDNVASKLGTSSRTLQRKISQLGETFSHILDEVRCDNACLLLRDSKLKIGEIATTVGYKDAGSFTRAFERWMGLSPQQFRNQYRNRKN